MERLTRKLPDGRNILTENFAYIRSHKYGSFVEGYAVDKLADYEDAEEQGLLLRLPCKIGSTVYTIHSVSPNRHVMCEIDNVDKFFLMLSVSEERFGKTVFLTKEEAEQALAKMKGKI